MLLFIKKEAVSNITPVKFQNISCYCLSNCKMAQGCPMRFQNISCYCLSMRQHTFKMVFMYFKTSHVIVYQFMFCDTFYFSLFQNISCYCLSIRLVEENIYLLEFQNISCYCLSVWIACYSKRK